MDPREVAQGWVVIHRVGRKVSHQSDLVHLLLAPDCMRYRTPHLIIDPEFRIITILAGRPNDPDWDSVTQAMSDLMEEVRQLGDALNCPGGDEKKPFWTKGQVNGRRGPYTSLTVGYSDGQGQGVCDLANLLSPEANTILDRDRSLSMSMTSSAHLSRSSSTVVPYTV